MAIAASLRGNVKHASWIVPGGKGLRLARSHRAWGVRGRPSTCSKIWPSHLPVAGVYAHAATQTSDWVLDLDEARFHLVVSPEVWRGFSGEDRCLTTSPARPTTGAPVCKPLKWQTESIVATSRQV